MSIDLHKEHLVSLSEARAIIPGRPALCTVFRWTLRGIRNVRLESCLVGGKRFSSIEAVDRFIVAINERVSRVSGGSTLRVHPRESQINRADRILENEGVTVGSADNGTNVGVIIKETNRKEACPRE